MEHELTKYVDSLYYAALRLTGNADEAEEITQETFLAAWQSLSRGYTPDNFWPWLKRILSNKHCDWLREKYRHPTISYDCWMMDEAFREPCADEAEDTDEALEAIRREVGYLARTHREVFVRFYMHGETIEQIAAAMAIPSGTVKSRLNKGRQQVRKGVEDMENFTKQSYEPEILQIACSGGTGLHHEPFSLVGYDDALAQNILIAAYEKPLNEVEIGRALGVPVGFIEPVVSRLVDGELMARTDGGKVYSDFIQYTRENLYANFREQLRYADEHYAQIREDIASAMTALRGTDYYIRQDERSRAKLELHYGISLMLCVVFDVSDMVAGAMPYEEYPYRKHGGRWLAMGFRYPANYDSRTDAEYWKYSIDGESGERLNDVYGLKGITLCCYGTALGGLPYNYLGKEQIKWMFELHSGRDSSTLEPGVLESADVLIEYGLLKKDSAVSLDIPVLTLEEYRAEKRLADKLGKPIFDKLNDTLAALIRRTCVKVPSHLTSVPKWQQYLHSRDSVAMAFLYRAMEDGLLLKNVDCKVPAALLVMEE
ncbi:MAG: RNA polymerase sigma factor [Clostridia bacterium]|nr:RNA polymerase sigma factor [Clostridia bacterium]